MLLFLMYISSYAAIYFSYNFFFLPNVLHFSEYDMTTSLYVFWLRKRRSIKYVRNWWRDAEVIYLSYRGYHASCIRTYLHYTFPCFWQHFCLIVSSFIFRNLTLPLFEKDVFVKKSCISPATSISVVIK